MRCTSQPGKDELMSTTPRLPSAVDGASANIVTVRRHAPAVMEAFDATDPAVTIRSSGVSEASR